MQVGLRTKSYKINKTQWENDIFVVINKKITWFYYFFTFFTAIYVRRAMNFLTYLLKYCID